ncbi:hypothetical protein AB0H96_52620 [Nonomuraea fuscirosea]
MRLESSWAARQRIARNTSIPSAFAPKAMRVGSSFTNPLTVAIRPAISARQPPSSSASGGGTMPVTVATAARNSARGMTMSIASHTSAGRISSPQPVASSNTSTATTNRAEALASLGARRTVPLPAARCALPSSSVTISRSSSSRPSSTVLA